MDTKRYLQDCIKSIAESVRFDSSQAAPLPGMPFGKGAADCLAHFLRLAESMGFEAHNYDNYVGEAVWGEGEAFAILAHLDVVPAGDGWTHPPFAGEIADGKLYGRGTMDDKGPAIVCLYCLKALKDAGFAPRRTIRLIVGCNEESGWECIAHYNRVARMPESGFSPDADFPVIYAEKGILHVCLRFALPDAPFSALYGGERANMVCDRAMAEGGPFDAARAKKYGLTAEDGKLVAEGRSAHASTPQEGRNALLPLLSYFAEEDARVDAVVNKLFRDEAGLTALRDETGSLTMSPDVAEYRDGQLCVTVDIRWPATLPREAVLSRLDTFGAPYEIEHCQEPLFSDRNGPLVSALRRVYERHTGGRCEPIAIGGGTYARALKNGAGFGPQFPGEPSTIHQKDEYISLENVQKLLDIYADAIRALTE